MSGTAVKAAVSRGYYRGWSEPILYQWIELPSGELDLWYSYIVLPQPLEGGK